MMKKTIITLVTGLFVTPLLAQHADGSEASGLATYATSETGLSPAPKEEEFKWMIDQFADIGVLRYQIPGWEKLTLNQKLFVYYLTQAGYAGRDIIWDQNYRYNLDIRHALDNIVKSYKGDKTSTEWADFMTYTKRVWFSNGIHHHYSSDKIMPACTKAYFESLLKATNTTLSAEIVTIMFDPAIDNKKVNLDPKDDLLLSSASNFYGTNVSQKDAEAFYAKRIDANDATAISHGLNSQLVKTANGIEERVYKVDGMYGEAIVEIVGWLKKALTVCENDRQAYALKLLIRYYETGDLLIWDAYNIAWVQTTKGDIDYINSFIEVYNDPLGYRGSFESVVEITDFEASERMKKMADHAQWFEDNSPLMTEHKKENVVGVSYKVVNVAGEAGDASPATPIGVNLPNANWIRAEYGSKSVSLGNIVYAYEQAGSSGMLDEFCYSAEEKERAKKYGSLTGKLHTAMHEVIGHASGKINPGIGSPKETLKNYANTLEEARADLVALYYIMDPQLVEWGLMPSLEVGKAQYDGYIRNGLMTQLRRIEPGKTIEEAHMRNRQMIAAWAFERGKANNVIERKYENGKTYFVVNDYEALRKIFGELLREVQRIKSEGDYEAGKAMVETYGVQVDEAIHQEVLARTAKMTNPPYSGFVNPMLTIVKDDKGTITDVTVSYPDSFVQQMLYYGEQYGFLKSSR
jgi:dipeptidyl-peptidase III